jgi:hypothetical protein
MLTQNIALVDQSKKLSTDDLSAAAAALQKQATRDLGPIWGTEATIDLFPDIKKIPTGYWPIIIAENINQSGAAGYHEDEHHQPYSMVELDASWQLTCSHEMCEMLIDPFGSRLVAGNSIKKGQGRVKYLVEVCDPCEDASFAYSVNGILLSDFYTPHYFDPVTSPSTRYSYTGAVKHPLEVLKGGYLSWYDPTTKKWFQATYFSKSVQIKELTGMKSNGASLRSQIDRLTKDPGKMSAVTSAAKKHAPALKLHTESSEADAGHWLKEIRKFGIK